MIWLVKKKDIKKYFKLRQYDVNENSSSIWHTLHAAGVGKPWDINPFTALSHNLLEAPLSPTLKNNKVIDITMDLCTFGRVYTP